MVNTTDLMITTFFDENAISFINDATGLDFKQVTKGKRCGGNKVVSFEAFATCPRCIGWDKLNELIGIFKKAPFDYPEYAVLLINDDDLAEFDGVVKIDT